MSFVLYIGIPDSHSWTLFPSIENLPPTVIYFYHRFAYFYIVCMDVEASMQ